MLCISSYGTQLVCVHDIIVFSAQFAVWVEFWVVVLACVFVLSKTSTLLLYNKYIIRGALSVSSLGM